MKLKLFPLMLLGAAVPSVAQTAAVSGTVVDAGTGAPVSGATISIQDQGITVTTGPRRGFPHLDSAARRGSADCVSPRLCRRSHTATPV